MKKNWTMKVAAGMLGLTMITSSFVGSTFAKYVTTAQGQDNARVAAWGVLVGVEGSAFGTEYEAEEQSYIDAGGTLSVASRDGIPKVVAPGTGSANLGTNLVATVIGQPEVAARYTIKGENVDDVILPAGTYTDYTQLVLDPNGSGTYGYTKTFELTKDYTPIKWNLMISKGTTTVNVAERLYAELAAYPALLTAAEQHGLTRNGCSFFDAIAIIRKVAGNDTYVNIVENALAGIVSGGRNFSLSATAPSYTGMLGGGVIRLPGSFELSYDFDPNKEMDFTFELTWEWAFEQVDDPANPDPDYTALYNKADTFLGNWAAYVLGDAVPGAGTNGEFVEPVGGSIWINANLTATATQID